MSAAHTIYCVKVLNTTNSLALQAFNTVDHVLFPLCILVVVGMLLSVVDTHGVGPADNNDSATMALSLILLVLLVCVVSCGGCKSIVMCFHLVFKLSREFSYIGYI